MKVIWSFVPYIFLGWFSYTLVRKIRRIVLKLWEEKIVSLQDQLSKAKGEIEGWKLTAIYWKTYAEAACKTRGHTFPNSIPTAIPSVSEEMTELVIAGRKELAKKYHPDRPGGNLAKMQAINACAERYLKGK